PRGKCRSDDSVEERVIGLKWAFEHLVMCRSRLAQVSQIALFADPNERTAHNCDGHITFSPLWSYTACGITGEASPSECDIKVTRDLVRAGQLLKIDVLDHVIVGGQSHASLRELGYIA